MQQISIDQLKALEALDGVPEEQLQWLINAGKCQEIKVDDILFTFGDTFDYTIFIIKGKLRLCIQQGKQISELSIIESGSIIGYIPFSRAKSSIVRAECIEDITMLSVSAEDIKGAVKQYFELTEALVHIMTSRVRFVTTQQQQHEKMFALGKLSAGLAHELNNPAAAIGRSASALSAQLSSMPGLLKEVVGLHLDNDQLDHFQVTLLGILNRQEKPALNMLQRSVKEEELTGWLESHHVYDFALAEVLAEEGFLPQDLETLCSLIPEQTLVPVFNWISYQLLTTKIVKEIENSASRISTLVGAVKNFSHMDRGGDKQLTDIHNGLESTLTMLNYKLRKGNIDVISSFDHTIPPLKALAGELNQVWTNIIDNAIDAMEINGKGILKITTEKERDNILVTVTDNGPGIPEEISGLIFDPFFTTKQMGKGSGLGLDVVLRIVKQHSGTVKLKSVPGSTSFSICLPVNQI